MFISLLFSVACVQDFVSVNYPPEIVDFSPDFDSIANVNDNVLFSVTVEDPDSNYADVLIRVESDIDGIFLSGFPDATGQFNQSYDSLSLGNHTLSLTVFDDSNNHTTAASSIIINAVPSLDEVLIFPENPTTNDTLEVFITQGYDIDSDEVSLAYRWYKNGAIQPDLTDGSLDSSHTSKGDIWMVEIVPSDQYGSGQPISNSTTIVNQSPTIETVSITPEQDVLLGTPITCEAVGNDADGEDIEVSFLWQVLSGGNFYDYTSDEAVFTPTAPLVQPGDELRCSAHFRDQDGAISDSLYTSVTVSNQAPSIDEILVLETNGAYIRAGATLECLASTSDPEGSDITLSYVWKNGTVVLAVDNNISEGLGSLLTLTSGNASRGDLITCEATAADPHGGSDTLTSTQSTVVNTAPVIQSIGITQTPNSQDDITCIPVATDIDGDNITHSVVWTVNGNVVQTGQSETLAGPFSPLDDVVCSFTPNDGQSFDGTGDTLSANTTVLNTQPEILDITLSPSTVQTQTNLNASVNATDIDGDAIALNYDWFVDGNLVKTGLGNSLDGSQHFIRNQQVYVAITPHDGIEDGQPVISDVINVVNTPPEILSALILPENPVPETDDLICTTEDPLSDPDNDTLAFTFIWTKNGAPYTGGTIDTVYANDTIPGNFTQDGDVWQCQMVVDDGFETDSADSSERLVACENGYGDIEGCAAESCLNIIEERPSQYGDDGVYWIDPDGSGAIEAYCDMTHDGGGWTLVMKAVGSDDSLAYDQIYWESTALLNPNDLIPNEDQTGSSSKYDAYNRTLGTTLRLEFLTPSEHNIHLNDMGTCSDGFSTTLAACTGGGICNGWPLNENDCLNNGTCDDPAYTWQSACESNGQTWTPYIWQPHEWVDGLTALDLFSGPEIMVQGVVLGYNGGCRSGLLTQDFSGDMQFVYQSQFFGINGYSHSTSGTSAHNRYSKIRFGYGSGIDDTIDAGWAPQIGIGIYVRYYRSYQYDDTYQYSTAWLDPDATNSCGTYGNGLGASADDATSNLWIR